MKKAPKQFIDILRTVKEEKGESLQIPYKMTNGKLAKSDEGFFHLLQYMGDDDPIKIIETTKDKLVVEIYYQGICRMLEVFEKYEQEEKTRKKNKKNKKRRK